MDCQIWEKVTYVNGLSALHLAAGNSHLEVVRFLVETGADLGVQNVNGFGARQWASQAGNHEIVALFAGNEEVIPFGNHENQHGIKIVDLT